MVEEDAQRKPLGTEDGFDRILNSQVQLCGFTFGLVPGRNPSWARSLKSVYPPNTWRLYPLAQQIAHDKAAMLHHDLGKFVTDRTTLSWTLGLGFAMSYVIRAKDLENPDRREWLRWLDRIQKSVCARYIGEPVQGFEHEQPSEPSADDGILRGLRKGPRVCQSRARTQAGKQSHPGRFRLLCRGARDGRREPAESVRT